MTFPTPGEDADAWMREVRDPANLTAGPPIEHRLGGVHAEYQLAQIPLGWAWHCNLSHRDGSAGGTPWKAEATRVEALAAAKRTLARWLLGSDDPHAAGLGHILNPDQPELDLDEATLGELH